MRTLFVKYDWEVRVGSMLLLLHRCIEIDSSVSRYGSSEERVSLREMVVL